MAQIPKFWKHDRITNNFFISEVDSGDIMLFKGKTANSRLN